MIMKFFLSDIIFLQDKLKFKGIIVKETLFYQIYLDLICKSRISIPLCIAQIKSLILFFILYFFQFMRSCFSCVVSCLRWSSGCTPWDQTTSTPPSTSSTVLSSLVLYLKYSGSTLNLGQALLACLV